MSTPARRSPLKPHWTTRYLFHRSILDLRQRRHPDDPWLTADAIAFLGQWVQPGDRCLEWGSGRSTWWLAARGASVATVEHDEAWAAAVLAKPSGPGAIELVHVAADREDDYVAAHPDLGGVDLALIDGIHREGCALRAVTEVRPGGLLVVDNIERHLPSRSTSPEARGQQAPEPGWRAFAEATEGWRRWWTTNGVTDTALWFKPAR